MKKIRRRANAALLLATFLILGVVIYMVRLAEDGDDWAMFRANDSVYENGILNVGTVTDRNGLMLAHAGDGVYGYADEWITRVSCLHVVGDFGGRIGTGVLTQFSDKLAGYSMINGTYSADGKGKTVELSVDANLNAVAYNALGGQSGCVLLSNYETGEILCMVSAPSYDPTASDGSNAGEGAYLNRTISSTYTPGSVFKLVTLTAALEQIPDLYSRSFTCEGSVMVDGNQVTCTGYHGTQTIEQALANSCNCAFAELALELGSDTLAAYTEALGLCSSQELDGISTAAGSFEKAEAGSSDLAWSGIGQYKDLVSPYGMLRLVSAIANGGEVVEPTLFCRSGLFSHPDTERLMDEGTAGKVKDMMSYTVQYAYGAGTFSNLPVCAKTGTAEVGDGTSHAWIVGFVDDPETPLAFTVVVEHGGGGLRTAGPIANAVLQAAVGQ